MKEKIKNQLANLKHLPGVYLMHNDNNEIIYVGKAKDLYKRVSQYFLRPQVGKVQKMVLEAAYFETIITKNEKEAFVLEMNLIQTHYPKYNILLKDDKHYPYIALRKKGDPLLTIKRNRKDKDFYHYGPYPSSSSAYKMIDLLNQLFPLRKCKTLKKEVCLYYHLNQCLAPCVNKIDEETNNKLREDVNKFLSGNNKDKYNEIKEKMIEASKVEKFELALSYKKILEALDHINEKQVVEIENKRSIDIFSFSIRENFFSFTVLLLRQGRLLAKENHILELFGDADEFFENLIRQYYLKKEIPSLIVTSLKSVAASLNELYDTEIICPTRGRLFELITSCKTNADNALDEFFLTPKKEIDKIALLDELGALINIKTPYHIELFDNSHLQGFAPVGAMVCFVNGGPIKDNYRKFNINQLEARSDVDSMKEVIFRHYKRSVEENKKLPDLILVDGGLTQIRAAYTSLILAGADIAVFGLYKDDKHRTKGIMDKDGNTYEINNKNLLFLLTQMQDEVHRFAITFHKEKRLKTSLKSYLDDVKGLGPKRKEIIKKAYPTLESLLNADVYELSQLVGENVAVELLKKLQK